MSYFTGKPKDSRQSARDSIVGLRSQLLVLDKREEFLQKKIDEELKKAKTNATANKRRESRREMEGVVGRPPALGCEPHADPFLPRRNLALPDRYVSHARFSVALAALRQKQAYEGELNRIAGTRLTLEAQVNAIETANLNAETMVAMKKGADALKGIHGSLYVLFSSPLSCRSRSSSGELTCNDIPRDLFLAISTRSMRRWNPFGNRWTSRTRSRTRSATPSTWASRWTT